MSEAAPVRADLHVHTRYSGWRHLRFIHPRDCYSEPKAVYDAALARGMRFVAITDHDAVEGALRLLEEPGVDSARVIVGEEVEALFPETGQWVHVNVLGITEGDHRRLQALKADVRDVAAYCRERGLLYVLNHPFQSYLGQKPLEAYIEDLLGLFTHVEGLNGGVPELQNRAVTELCRAAAARGLVLTQAGGSDAHRLGRVGAAWTQARAETAQEFLREVRAGRCQVGGSTAGTLGLLRDVYAVVATYYGRLYSGRGEAPGAAAYALDAGFATLSLPAALLGLPAAIVVGNQIRQKVVSRHVLARLASVDWKRLLAAVGA
jgi:predicted metal-dependent phosphoesterase TrpH